VATKSALKKQLISKLNVNIEFNKISDKFLSPVNKTKQYKKEYRSNSSVKILNSKSKSVDK